MSYHHLRKCCRNGLIGLSILISAACSSSPNLTLRPPPVLLGNETVYLAVDLQEPALTVERDMNGHPFSMVELKMRCPLGGEEFTATIPRQAFWTKISLGGTFFTDPDVAGANIPNPWPVPQCPSNGFPISKLVYSEKELIELSAIFAQQFFITNAKENVSSYIVYRSLLARSIDEGLACTKANRIRLAAFEARFFGNEELENSYNNEAIEEGRTCLALTNQSAEAHIQHIVAHINQLRLVGRFDQAKDAISYLRNRYSQAQINETSGSSYNSIYPDMASILSKIEELVDNEESGFYIVSMRNPITESNPLLDEYRQLLSIEERIKPAE